MPGILKVGLTGGIACGRSTLSRYLTARGMLVLDADSVAHELLARGGAAVEEVAVMFGEGVRLEGGGISRPALGKIVFQDPPARARLEAILHPRILAILDADTQAFERRRGEGIVVVDAALMVETGSFRRYHRLVVAHCSPEAQLARLMKRDGLTRESAAARIAAQAPLAKKIELADYAIGTDGGFEETKAATLRVAALLEEDLASLPHLAPRRKGIGGC
jgi:dephospho-CoA kinase